jgi:hypothetical protein
VAAYNRVKQGVVAWRPSHPPSWLSKLDFPYGTKCPKNPDKASYVPKKTDSTRWSQHIGEPCWENIVGTRNGQFFLVRWLTGRNTSNDSLNQIEKCFQAFFSYFGLLFLENYNFRGLSFWTIPHPFREVLKLLFIFLEKVDTILNSTPAILEIPRHRLYSRIISEKRKAYEILMPGKRKFPLPPTTTSIHLINLN